MRHRVTFARVFTLLIIAALGWPSALVAPAIVHASATLPGHTVPVFAPLDAPGTFRAATSAASTPITTVVVSKPAGVTTNDVLLAAITVRAAPSITAPSGWTLIRSDVSGTTITQATYSHVAGASEPSTYTWTFGTSVSSTVGTIVAYSGVNTTTPVDVSGGQTNTSSASVTAPSVTTTVANDMVVGFFGTANDATFTAATGMTERSDALAHGTADISAESADVVKATAGATGTKVATASKAAINVGQLVALKPSGTIAFRAAATASSISITSLTVNKPTGTVADDVLLASITGQTLPTTSAPVGWSLVRSDTDGAEITQAIFVRTAGGSEPASYTFTFSGAVSSAVGGIIGYSGLDPLSPIDTSGGQGNASSTSVTAPSITTTVADVIVAAFFATADNDTFTPPTGMTERFDVLATGKSKVGGEGAEVVQASPGATGTKVATASTAAVNVGALVGLRPRPPTVTSTTAAFGGSISWMYADASGDPQAKFHVDIATSSSFGASIVSTSGDVASAGSAWAVPATGLADDTSYWYEVKVNDGHSWSTFAQGQFTYDAFLRGDETYYASTPFDLSGGLRLDIGAHNGEARLSRDLFSIPSYGPPGELSLTYSSLDASSAGRFGVGWSSNLTQYLTFPTGLVEWHRPDAGRVAFSGAGSTWTVAGGHFETLAYDGVAHTYTITQKDQTKLVFQDAAPGRLLKIQSRFAKALTLVWNTSSATATDASGRVISIVIDSANNRITGVTDSAGRVWGFAYTGTDLTTLTDPATKTTTFGYDASHHLTTITRVRSRAAGGTDTITWTIGYTTGKATSVLDPIGAAATGTPAHTFTYNAGSTVAGLLKTYPATVVRNTTTYTLDPFGRPTSILDPGGYTTSQSFDLKGDLLSIARPIDLTPTPTWATSTYTYDATGNELTETSPEASATDLATNVMSYNSTNDVVTRSESDNFSGEKVITLNLYDGTGHLTSVVENCTTTGTTPPTPASGCTAGGAHDGSTNLTTTYVYTANDQIDVEWDPRGFATKHQYDANGNETATISDCTTTGTTVPTRGSTCTAAGTHDAATNVTRSATFDLASRDGKAGLPGTETDETGAVTTDAYDALGRQTSEVLPGDATIPVLTRTTAFDELDDRLTVTEVWPGLSPSRVTTGTYDLRGRETSKTDPLGVATTSTFDAAGDEVASIVGGVTTNRTFDGLGNAVEEVVDPLGLAVTTDHTFNGQRVETITAPTGTSTTRSPDMAARITVSSVDPTGLNLATTYDYGAHAATLTATQPGGLAVATTSDRLGRATQTITSQGGASLTDTFVFDANGNPTTQSAPHATGAGIVTTTTYDALDRATVVVSNDVGSPSGSDQDVTTTSFHDAAGRMIATADPAGIVSRTFYNLRGLATKTIANCTDSGTSPPANPATCAGTGTADASTNVVSTTTYDGSGAVSSTTTSALSGNVTTATTYNPSGQPVEVVVDQGGLNLTSDAYYDATGNQVAAKDPRGTVTRTFYDAAGRVSKTIVNCTNSGTTPPADPATCAGTGTADATWNVVSSETYDVRGNRTSAVAPNGRVTKYAYDTDDRLVSQTENYVVSPTQADQSLTTYFYYDPAGNRAATKAPTVDRTTFAVTRYLYDVFGRMTNEIQNCTDSGTTPPASPAICGGTGTRDAATNLETITSFDDHGNKVSVTAPDPSASTGTSVATVKTEYSYDGVDRLCRVLENAQSGVVLQSLAAPCSTAVSGTATTNVSTRYTYDVDGNLATMVDGLGQTTTYGYDKAGRMTSLLDAMGKTLAWGYDVRGNRSSQTDRTAGQSVTWTYDHADRMATRLADGVTVTYGYDATGIQTSAGDGTGTISTTFDALSRPLTVTTSDDSGAATSSTYSFAAPTWSDPTGSYSAVLDKFGRETSVTDPIHQGSPFTTTYRADAQPLSVAAPNANTTTYGYDNAGHPATMTTLGTGSVSRAAYTWTLNRAGDRLTENSQVSGDPTNGTTTYGYDALGRLTGYTPPAAISPQTYTSLAVPNRATMQIGTAPVVTTNYDVANRPTTDSAGGTYSSDFDGRLTAMPGSTMTYDSLGRLTSVTTGGATSNYTYDPLDRLRMVTRSGAVQRFRYVGGTTEVAQILDGTGSVLRSIANGWAGARLVDWTGSGTNQRFYGTNGHLDVTWTADTTGVVTATLRYDPWGVLRSSVGTSLPDFRFQGSWFETSTALSWAVHRWYVAALGRFLSEDALLGDVDAPGSRHLYAYGGGEPVARRDPNGASWCDFVDPCSNLYHGSRTTYWSHSLRNPNHAHGYFVMDEFIRTKWVDAPFTSGLKGDWRPFKAGGDCWEARACVVVNFDYGIARVIVRPTCDKRSEWTYRCFDANAINTFVPLNSAVTFSESTYGIVDINWSLNQSATWGFVPINGSLHLVPPGAKSTPSRFRPARPLPPEVRVTGDGYPSIGLYYTRRGVLRTIIEKREGTPIDLLPGLGDWDNSYEWPNL